MLVDLKYFSFSKNNCLFYKNSRGENALCCTLFTTKKKFSGLYHFNHFHFLLMKNVLTLTPRIGIFRNFKKRENFFPYSNKVSSFKFFKRTYFIELFNYEKWSLKEFLYLDFENLSSRIFFDSNQFFCYTFDSNFLNFLSKENIFLSNEKILNDFMYYNHVT